MPRATSTFVYTRNIDNNDNTSGIWGWLDPPMCKYLWNKGDILTALRDYAPHFFRGDKVRVLGYSMNHVMVEPLHPGAEDRGGLASREDYFCKNVIKRNLPDWF